jgi:hypothetical protein
MLRPASCRRAGPVEADFAREVQSRYQRDNVRQPGCPRGCARQEPAVFREPYPGNRGSPTGTGKFAERSAALHQKARLEPRRRDAVELDRAAAAQ